MMEAAAVTGRRTRMKQEGRCLKGLELMAITTPRRQNVPPVQEFRGRSGDPVLEIETASSPPPSVKATTVVLHLHDNATRNATRIWNGDKGGSLFPRSFCARKFGQGLGGGKGRSSFVLPAPPPRPAYQMSLVLPSS